MANLAQFLRLLERDDVSEIAFQTGSPPAMAVAGKFVAVSSSRVSAQHIESFLNATPLSKPVPPGGADAQRDETVLIGGKPYSITFKRVAGKTLLKYRPSAQPDASQQRPSTVAAADDRSTAGGGAVRPEVAQPLPSPASSPAAATKAQTPSSGAPGPQGAQNRPPLAAGGGTAKGTAPVPAETSHSESDHTQGTGERLLSVPRLQGEPQPDPDLVELFRQARAKGASDVHVTAGRPASIRCAGMLQLVGEPISAKKVEHMVVSLLTNLRRDQLERLGYTDFSIQLDGVGPVRGNVGKQSTGMKGSFRLVTDHAPSLEELGMPEELSKITMYHQGLAVVSGPNGHGKTTTLAALVNLVNQNKAAHIITVEDPVEVVHPFAKAVLSQREVGIHTASFARALKGALREDPDVIVIGELRDLETVEIALEAAETGHLVITTMSTRSGAKTIDRLIDMFPPDKQAQVRATLAGALKLIVSQRLLPNATDDGLVAGFELITGNIQLWNLIRDNKLLQLPSLMQRGRSLGMIRFDESLAELVKQGRISEEVALGAADNPAELKRYLGVPAATEAVAAPDSAQSVRGRFLGRKK